MSSWIFVGEIFTHFVAPTFHNDFTRQIESLLLRLKDFISAIVQAVGKFANFDAYTDW